VQFPCLPSQKEIWNTIARVEAKHAASQQTKVWQARQLVCLQCKHDKEMHHLQLETAKQVESLKSQLTDCHETTATLKEKCATLNHALTIARRDVVDAEGRLAYQVSSAKRERRVQYGGVRNSHESLRIA
jgi:hypothetical protein